MTNKQRIIGTGIAVMLFALWAGGYLVHISDDQWWEVPAFLTALFVAVSGYIYGAYGVINVKD